jgi:hypothetical protein
LWRVACAGPGCFALLLFAVAAAPVLASGKSSGEVPPGETSPSGEDSSAGVEAAELEEREQAEWLSSLEASIDAYASLSTGEAQDLLVEAFPEQLKELNADPARVLSELDIENLSLPGQAMRQMLQVA